MLIEGATSNGEPWFWLRNDQRSYSGIATEVRVAKPGYEREFLEQLRDSRPATHAAPNGTFRSGWVVAFGYEFGVALMGLTPQLDAAPPAIALRVESPAAQELDATGVERDSHLENTAELPRDVRAARAFATWRRSEAQYRDDVNTCLDAIAEGNAYVLCLTDTAEIQGEFDPHAVHGAMRGAVRSGVISAGDHALVSASPERFLSVRSGRIVTHPIKGTRPRGLDAAHDAALAAELAADPKERAENLMIVDLMRNDLSRVCEPGSVGVEGLLRVETHPYVHQLVSTVTGTLREGSDVYDALVASFPGGSMTGAPKRSAVKILGELEGEPRGLYSGCFGWIDDSGDAELAMTIRSVELRRGRALVGAGGGVTADSDPERELAEKNLKASPLLAALASLEGRYP